MTHLTKKAHFLLALSITLLIGVLFYFLNYYTPLFWDDYMYAFSFSTDERITSLNQILDSQIAHYSIMNGRVVNHIIAQAMLLFGDTAFNFINTIAFLVLLFLIYYHAIGTFKNFSILKFSTITMLLFLSAPAFGQSFLWITGASNYLYGILIILLFLSPYRMYANSKNSKPSALMGILASIISLAFGIIAGWTNENTSVAMIIIIIGYIIYYYVNSIKIRLWNITGCIGGIIGCVLMLTAPGNQVRLGSYEDSNNIVSWIKHFIFQTVDLFTCIPLLILLFVVLFTVYLFQLKEQNTKSIKETIIDALKCDVTIIYFIGCLASFYSMIVSPIFPARAWSGPIIFFLIVLVCFSLRINITSQYVKIGKFITICFVIILSLATYFNAFFELKNIHSAYETRISLIETAIANGEKDIKLPTLAGETGYSCFSVHGDLSVDCSQPANESLAHYYGLDSITSSN